MSLFSKVGASISDEAAKLPNRFLQGGGFMQMGAVTREPRANTTEELVSSIKAYAKTNPEIAEFVKHLDEMNPTHLGLAQDVIDLSNTHELLNTNINLGKITQNGKSIMGHILEMLPATSNKNPGAVELCETVINNSDATNSKYFLTRLFDYDLPKMGSLSEQMSAVKEAVPVIAKDTLSGGYTMDYSKNNEFFNFIQHLCSEDSKPENIKLIGKICDIIDQSSKKVLHNVNLDELRVADTAKVKQNMDVLPQVLKNAEEAGKPIDVSAFLEHNVNLD